MELLNSKINHPDYQCDSTAWGVVLLNSEHFKLLYDIYHMQIDEGDIIGTLETIILYRSLSYSMCPGRNEIDDTQEKLQRYNESYS
jgi:hydroxypyruvate isomerase